MFAKWKIYYFNVFFVNVCFAQVEIFYSNGYEDAGKATEKIWKY
jgi:hypothetical protein